MHLIKWFCLTVVLNSLQISLHSWFSFTCWWSKTVTLGTGNSSHYLFSKKKKKVKTHHVVTTREITQIIVLSQKYIYAKRKLKEIIRKLSEVIDY